MGVNCLQIWNGNIEPSTERDKFKLFVDDFIEIFKSTDLIESLEEKSIGNGMFDLSVKYKVLPEEIHIIYQDLRSGDKDDNPKKRFQVSKFAHDDSKQYFYVGGYDAGDKKIIVSILNGTKEFNKGSFSISSLWVSWDELVKTYKNGLNIWRESRPKVKNLITCACTDSNITFLHNAIISRSLDTNNEIVVNDENECLGNQCLYKFPRQQIYYGAPGTGKSHTINKETKGHKTFRTTFHPDSDYSTFVGSYKPVMEEVETRVVPVVLNNGAVFDQNNGTLKEKKISYKFVKQTFMKAYIAAWREYAWEELKKRVNGVENPDSTNTPEIPPVFLIIEEINRGNCAQIFGDLFQLLDRNENGFSQYPVHADDDIRQCLVSEHTNDDPSFGINGLGLSSEQQSLINSILEQDDVAYKIAHGEVLVLPPNLYIWATMNTSDQSLFPIDSAFKRRWDWEYEPIKYKNTDWIINIQNNSYSWASFQKEINNRIFNANSSEDKMLGDYFVNPHDGIITEKLLLNKILFYLWNDVCKDGEGEIFKTSETEDVSFSELHGEGGAQKLIDMMAYLGVPPLDYGEEDAGTDTNAATYKKLPRYSIGDSQDTYSTPKTVKYIIENYAREHTEMSVDKMISLWNEISGRKNCLVASWTPSPNDNQSFANKRRTEIKWDDKSAWLINGWTEELFKIFIKNVQKKFGIEIKRVE